MQLPWVEERSPAARLQQAWKKVVVSSPSPQVQGSHAWRWSRKGPEDACMPSASGFGSAEVRNLSPPPH